MLVLTSTQHLHTQMHARIDALAARVDALAVVQASAPGGPGLSVTLY